VPQDGGHHTKAACAQSRRLLGQFKAITRPRSKARQEGSGGLHEDCQANGRTCEGSNRKLFDELVGVKTHTMYLLVINYDRQISLDYK
jgi:hypothetical protein